jgi:hypothetical protein
VIDFSRTSIAISTHNRPAYLIECAKAWAETAPDYRAMFAVVNHPDGATGFSPPDPMRCRIIHTGRVPEHAGCMAKTWNLAMQWAFRDPQVDWCLCSMDDAEIRPGWANVVAAHDFDLYFAPAGDLVFLLHRRVLREVGWFDEHFPVVGFQEWDWQARAIRALGLPRVSLDDAHGWRHNPIGLSAFWIHRGEGAAPTTRQERYNAHAQAWLELKWGCPMQDMVHLLSSGNIPAPRMPEIEWYPWFQR